MNSIQILEERKSQIHCNNGEPFDIKCEKHSIAGSVSQRACVFCGSRVVLYPIADALHLIHGPIGCAAYTWDIRGSLSSGPELHRLSFSTDLQENNIIFGGEKKLYRALCELIDRHDPNAAFVYATCIVGIIGDDMDAVCKRVSAEKNIPVIPVHSEGFKGTKKDGYRAACEALACLVGTGQTDSISPYSINILGDFNIAGETWMVKNYYESMGVEVVATITGDGRIADIQRAHGAKLNVVQCSGSMMYLAKIMEEKYGIPFIRVSYLGIEDTSAALYNVAQFFGNEEILTKTDNLITAEVSRITPGLDKYKNKLTGKKAAIYVGGAFKAFSLIKTLNCLGMKTVLVGSQTGNKDDYRKLKEMCEPGTVIIDDANPLELSRFVLEKNVDIFIGGVKERPLAYKLGIGFCDHNHQRRITLAGFEGMINFAKEVYSSVLSPVWQFTPRMEKERSAL
ncbi:MAG: nitrogenase iron-molybdenum cofactor biosynthesis protein NifE [Spirochaetes bacterium]|nr:nitrogenase iron-molybdenum cofactor biosynthesis protein NifE [Spirochaetota bacterium]MCK5267415.1 nitrogenase iron-molybdenum cofactor biosynthesis protein NifE [Spirochaetota bacterium]